MRFVCFEGLIIDGFQFREFFFAPVIEYGPLAEWKEIAGEGQEMQDVFWYIKEAIDAYWGDRPFQVTIKAGCLIGRKVAAPAPDPSEPVSLQEETSPFLRQGDDLPELPGQMATGSVQLLDSADLLIEEVSEAGVELVGEEDVQEEPELDAFIDGRPRPPHLDD